MNIALYGRSGSLEINGYIQQLISKLESLSCKLWIYQPFYESIRQKISFNSKIIFFNNHDEIAQSVDFLFSIGGDGTLLDTITLVRDSQIPVMGINLGRMGFLSSVQKEMIIPAVEEIVKGNFILNQRSLIQLQTPDLFGNLNFALNELTINKKDSSSMILIHVYVNNQFLNSYWADGLIIATPTGSTGYSLSCNGPIITPDSENFVITPIATHNLTVRPIVIPDNSLIRINVEGRENRFLVGLDSRSVTIDSSTELLISKADFKINLVKQSNDDFFATIRKKLKWGLDFRN
ncbi:MAG TPA: NAD kinase [Bacteroidales bacterium]|nr:NAD kinase [Bacteroidales bacterium]HPT03793.1 NAD kinase [Bacteroidales bacterium]